MSVLFPKLRVKTQNLRKALRLSAEAFSVELPLKYELAALLKFRDAAHSLREWIEFHRLVGVEHFYLYNHNSSDDFERVLAPYVKEGLVTLHHRTGPLVFPEADSHCFATYKHEARWIAVLDDDEFLFPVSGSDLRKVLRNYEAYPGVVVHWLMFGSAGHKSTPEGLVIENYTRCDSKLAPVMKSIVNPRKVLAPKSPHYPYYKNRELAVNERKVTVPLAYSEIAVADKLRINHYWCKSEEDFKRKMQRGYGDQPGIDNPRTMKGWNDALRFNVSEDTKILRFLDPLKARLSERC